LEFSASDMRTKMRFRYQLHCRKKCCYCTQVRYNHRILRCRPPYVIRKSSQGDSIDSVLVVFDLHVLVMPRLSRICP
jgi:hypothetical protein